MNDLEPAVKAIVIDTLGGARVVSVDVVQSLWSGYGQILRIELEGASVASVVVKRVQWPTVQDHPRGWTSSLAHDRKVRSYAVEAAFYRDFAPKCGDGCRVPRLLAEAGVDDGVLLVLEDLDVTGFPLRRTDVGAVELAECLTWLANFHATFLSEAPNTLWPTGTYWHLATRPDELAAIEDSSLASAAPKLDQLLQDAAFQTFVHGDAKVANFCFSDGGQGVAAVDFQYVGRGCGIKDVAYFIGSCLDEDECERQEAALLELYFTALSEALASQGSTVDVAAVCREWRALYPVAWTDFYRFLAGWSPEHWKVHAYTRRLAREVLATL